MPPLGRPIGYHITLRLQDDRPIAMTAVARRALARVVLAQGRARGLLAFGAADNHLHVELATDRATAGAFCQCVGTALRRRLRLAAAFEPARIRPLENQRHAYNVFRYALQQDAHHGVDLDLARDATSLPDLLGLRVVDDSVARRVREHLPRVRFAELASALPTASLEPGEALDLGLLAEAAASAYALPSLEGRHLDVVRAKRAAVHAAAGLPTCEVAAALSLGERSVQAIRRQAVDAREVSAVRRQALLRAALARRAHASTAQ